MPEAGVIIAQAAVCLALAPKSTAVYKAFNSAMAAVEKEPHAPVPLHIRNAPTYQDDEAARLFGRLLV